MRLVSKEPREITYTRQPIVAQVVIPLEDLVFERMTLYFKRLTDQFFEHGISGGEKGSYVQIMLDNGVNETTITAKYYNVDIIGYESMLCDLEDETPLEDRGLKVPLYEAVL